MRTKSGTEIISWLHDDYEIVRIERLKDEDATAIVIKRKGALDKLDAPTKPA